MSKFGFAPSSLKGNVDLHTAAVSNACNDIQAIRDGEEIIAALAFSALFSFLTPKHNLTSSNHKHHYDIFCRQSIYNLPRVSKDIGYKVILPLGTIGKLLNHVFHRKEFLDRILNSSNETQTREIILKELKDTTNFHGGGFTGHDLGRLLSSRLAGVANTPIKQNVLKLSEMFNSESLFGPGDFFTREEIISSFSSRTLWKNVHEAMYASKRAARHWEPRDEAHVQFEAIMDTFNITLPIRLNGQRNKRVLFFGSQLKRVAYGKQNVENFSRHMLSMFYWEQALDRANKSDALDKQSRALAALNFSKRQFENIKLELDNLINDNEIDIHEGLSEAITNEMWMPFLVTLSNKYLDMSHSNEELARLTQESIAGDSKATRELVEHASVTTDDALKILSESLRPDDIDLYMYAVPTLADNERFQKIEALMSPRPLSPKLG